MWSVVHIAFFRFYEELNFFLPPDQRKVEIAYSFDGHPAIKDAIEALGIPHTEVEVILVNGKSVSFDYQIRDGDRVSVYPMFESLDLSSVILLREKPLRSPKFICDVHLGKLATLLRLLGFDTIYRNDLEDDEIIQTSLSDHRVILTCDRGILKHSVVTHGYCLRSRKALEQATEVLNRFDLYNLAQPFSRCTVCNGELKSIDKEAIHSQLPARAAQYYHEFNQCAGCSRIYWRGSHFERISLKLKRLLDRSKSVDEE